MTFDKVKIINFPKIPDDRGNLSFFEGEKHVPFSIARAYWIYDVPGGETRGGHAYETLQEVIIALSGSFDVVLNDGRETRKYFLNRSYYGLYIPRMMWRHLENFSTNSFALVVADQFYNENEYLRDYKVFKEKNIAGGIY
jgi:dTDP-4-dehydrorhamnose 3,5-epimerase-like enzyme